MNDYIIIGDTDTYKDCLVCVCGTLDHAEYVLHRMQTAPTKNDLNLLKTHRNLRIKEVPEKDCWWRGNCD